MRDQYDNQMLKAVQSIASNLKDIKKILDPVKHKDGNGSCESCRFETLDEFEMPCRVCCHCYTNHWEA